MRSGRNAYLAHARLAGLTFPGAPYSGAMPASASLNIPEDLREGPLYLDIYRVSYPDRLRSGVLEFAPPLR